MEPKLLQKITISIAEARAVAPILKQIVSGIAEASETALVRLWLVEGSRNDGERPVLQLAASGGRSITDGTLYTSIEGNSARIPMGSRKIGQVAFTGKAFLISDVSPDQAWVADPAWIAREQIRSFAGQPLIYRGEVLGVLAVFSRSRFGNEEFDWLRSFADHAAVAIANARAFEEIERLRAELERENNYLQEEVRNALNFGSIIGRSPALQKVVQQIELVAPVDATVLIEGESGTGKELIARAIHERGPRRHKPLIRVNCGAIPEELFESEFFGHVKGAFTGAVRDRAGRFELAHEGVLFLDEIGEVPMALQPKLLRAIQEKQFERVGEERTRTVDVRIVAATNRDLKAEVAAGRFRADLYYRLSVFPLQIPPLRDRHEDIPLLARHFIEAFAARAHVPAPVLAPAQVEELQRYHWPGNIRELQNMIERAMILAQGARRLRLEIPDKGSRSPRRPERFVRDQEPSPAGRILSEPEMKEFERKNLLAALAECEGRVFGEKGAAKLLRMPPTTLLSRMKAFGIKRTILHEIN